MWVLLGVSDDTVEQETFVYFIGVFDDLSLAKAEKNRRIETDSKRNNYIIKPIDVNIGYDYEWSYKEEDEVK